MPLTAAAATRLEPFPQELLTEQLVRARALFVQMSESEREQAILVLSAYADLSPEARQVIDAALAVLPRQHQAALGPSTAALRDLSRRFVQIALAVCPLLA